MSNNISKTWQLNTTTMSNVILNKCGATNKVIPTWGQDNRYGLEIGLEMIPLPSDRNQTLVLNLPRDQ